MAVALPLVAGIAGLAASKLLAPKMQAPEMPAAVPAIQRRENAVSDALASRRGSLANKRTSAATQETLGGAKTKLGA